MNNIIAILILFTTIQVYAFQDYDIDGVEDSIDRCANTPFDVIVDRFGCGIEKDKKDYFGKFMLSIGTQVLKDKSYKDIKALSLIANYRYKDFDITLSNIQSTTMGSYVENNFHDTQDIYLGVGYSMMLEQSSLKVSMGTRFLSDGMYETNSSKISRGKGRGRGKGKGKKNDYYTSLNYSYQINTAQNFFLFGAYTLTGDTPSQNYKNYGSFSLGTGYSVTREFYSSIAYNYVGSIYADTEAEQSLSLFGNYRFTENLFASATYKYALDDLSYDHSLLLLLGVVF